MVRFISSLSLSESFKKISADDSALSLNTFSGGVSFGDFYKKLLGEHGLEKEILSDFLAQNVIASICAEEFQRNKALKNLTKSNSFFRELCSLFAQFSDSAISVNELNESLKDLHRIDTSRMEIIIHVYEKYLRTMDNNNFLDIHIAPGFLSEVLNIKMKMPAVKVNAPDGISAVQQRLLECLFEDVEVYVVEPNDSLSIKTDCLGFEDVYSEIGYLAQKIKTKVAKGEANFNDFAVLVRDFDSRQKFADLFKTFQIPISSESDSDEFVNFKRKLVRYLKICRVYEKLGIEEFSKTEFEKLKYTSKAQIEICYEELNTYIQTILTELLEDSCARDRFLSLREQKGSFSLLNVIYSNLEILKENDKKALQDELDNLKKFFYLYKNGKIFELVSISAVGQKEETTKRILGSAKSVLNLYRNVLGTQLPLDVLIELIENAKEGNDGAKNTVLLSSLNSIKSRKFVFIPCMIEGSLPKKNNAVSFISHDANEKISGFLRKNHPEFKHVIKTDEEHLENEERLFIAGMHCATEELVLSTHSYEDKKQCPPSAYFEKMSVKADCHFEDEKIAHKAIRENTVFSGLSMAKAPVMTKAPVLEEGEVLRLNPSAISTFLKCPRRYYYKGLLNLKEQSVFAANYGNIVHAILDVFNRTCLDKYNKATLLVLKDILFESANNSESSESPAMAETALQAGFTQLDVDLINAADKLSLKQMEQNFENALKELDENGWFNKVPDSVETEKSFKFEMSELPGVVFDGRIDAILKEGETYRVIDYKTGKNKDNDLEYATSDFGVNFLTKTGKVPSRVEDYEKKYDYQIPLYYLACQNSKDLRQYKDKVDELGLEYVRPSTKDGGWNEDFISAERIESQKLEILGNLKNTVIDRIRSAEEFEKCESFNCSGCAYDFLCDSEEECDD